MDLLSSMGWASFLAGLKEEQDERIRQAVKDRIRNGKGCCIDCRLGIDSKLTIRCRTCIEFYTEPEPELNKGNGI